MCRNNNGDDPTHESGRPGTTLANMRNSELPLHGMLLRAAANYIRKALNLSMCCGNHSEPGC